MNKRNSPAINFYTSDFLTGTTFFTNEQVGAYIRLLCYQHQFGRLSKEQVYSVTEDEVVLSKFKVDKKGLYFNERMEFETEKKKKYSESRANNRLKTPKIKETSEEDINNISNSYEKDMINTSNSYEEHMENENENIYIYNNILNKNKSNNRGMGEEERKEKKFQEKQFEEFWKQYPKKRNKAKCLEWYLKNKPSVELHNEIILSLLYFKDDDQWKKENGLYIPYPTTFLNQKRWEDLK